MVPGSGSYLTGALALLALCVALAAGGFELRRWLAPDFSGALARLAEAVLALTVFLLTLEILGSFGGLYRGTVIAGGVLAGAGAAVLGRWRLDRKPGSALAAPSVPSWALAVAIGVAAVVVAQWSIPTRLNLHQGIFSGDSTWYHMPFAARFAQGHSTWNLQFTDPLRLATWFYPASSELLNSVGILLFHSDWLMPVTNLFWLLFGLLAAYCVGRPRGSGPATLVAGATVLGSGVLLSTQAGDARNDSMAIALLIAFAALLVNAEAIGAVGSGPKPDRDPPLQRRAGPLLLAGLAGGLAVSVKLTMLPAVAVITAAVIALARRRRRLGTAGPLLGGALIGGGYWYLRNLAHSGNPVPQIHALGPLTLPYPHQMRLYPRQPSSVAHYLTNGHVISSGFLPGLDKALGPAYPAILLLSLGAALFAILDSRGRAPKALGLGALVAAAVYTVTPLTAAGPPGEPHGFFTNLRYLMPALALGLVLVPLAPPLLKSRLRIGVTLGALSAVFIVSLIGPTHWPSGYLVAAILVALGLLAAPVALALLLARGRVTARTVAVAAAVGLAVAGIVGRHEEVGYARNHYSRAAIVTHQTPSATWIWAQRLHHKRIAVAGGGVLFFAQYFLYGKDLSNWVQYIGEPGPHGQYTVPPSCGALRGQINRGRYDYIVLTKYGDDAGNSARYPFRAWTEHAPGLRTIFKEKIPGKQDVFVYRVSGRVGLARCGSR